MHSNEFYKKTYVNLLTPNEPRLLRLRCIATKRSMSSSDCAGHSGVTGVVLIACSRGDFGGVAMSLLDGIGERPESNELVSSIS